MYKYEYETINCELGGWGLGSGNIYEIEDYRAIINKRASKHNNIAVEHNRNSSAHHL